jgi:hypothetical protein
MPDAISDIHALIEQGKQFNFKNVGPKSEYGTPNALSDDWLVWTHHVAQVAGRLADSPIKSSLVSGLGRTVIGNEEYAFVAAQGLILNGLKAADRVFGQPIPASDRTVSLGHNSPEQIEALDKIDKLVAAVEATNDFPGDSDFKEQMIAELSAGHRLLQAAKVRVSAVREAIGPPLKWILEKAGGAVIGKIAGDVWQYLAHLNIL